MFPDLKWSTIHKVNKAIDKPRTYSRRRATAPMFPKMPQNMMYTPLTYMKAHRKWNHDWQSALQMGYMKGGIPGMFAARAHLFGDALSDMIAQRYGIAFRDVCRDDIFVCTLCM